MQTTAVHIDKIPSGASEPEMQAYIASMRASIQAQKADRWAKWDQLQPVVEEETNIRPVRGGWTRKFLEEKGPLEEQGPNVSKAN